MDDFDLILDPLASADEDTSIELTGTVNNIDAPGSEVTLDIDWGDSTTDNVGIVDGGSGDTDGAEDGSIGFSVPHVYSEDGNFTINVDAQEQIISGTDAVFVIDRSGSTSSSSQIDVDGDGEIDRDNDSILDAEVAAFQALNQNLIDRGLGNSANVSVVAFNSFEELLDLDPTTDGVQTFTTPLADADGNGLRDIDEVLDALVSGGGTDFEDALRGAVEAVNNAGTPPGNGTVVFLSDGEDFFFDTGSADTIRDNLGQNLRVFGVGPGSDLEALQQVDVNAEQFNDISELLDLFDGTGGGAVDNSDSASVTITIDDIPETPEAPVTPEMPETPETPEMPETPEAPITPEMPETPEAPVTPEMPETPVTPEAPVTPEMPETPVTPEAPVTPETPVTPEAPVTPEMPETPEAPVTPEMPETPTIPVLPNLEVDALNFAIEGTADNDGLTGTDAADLLEGRGGNDVIDGEAGNDQINGGAGLDTALYILDPAGVTVDLITATAIDGYGDTDTLNSIENIIGSGSADIIGGDDNVNNLTGGSGEDAIAGQGGDDFIVGGADSDILTGGAGADRFVYVSSSEGGDSITDFEVGTDRIVIVGATFAGDLGLSGGTLSSDAFFADSAAVDADDRFGYNSSTGQVLFDADGSGASGAEVLLTLENIPTGFSSADIAIL